MFYVDEMPFYYCLTNNRKKAENTTSCGLCKKNEMLDVKRTFVYNCNDILSRNEVKHHENDIPA